MPAALKEEMLEHGERAAQERQHRFLPMLLMIAGLEEVYAVMLPNLFYALQADLGLALSDLALMTVVQSLSASLAGPLWCTLADRGIVNRKTLLTCGCLVNGIVLMLLSVVSSMNIILPLRCLCGLALAALKPVVIGIIANTTEEKDSGKVFSTLEIAMQCGQIIGTVTAVNLSRREVVGFQGWRICFLLVGFLCILVGSLTAAALPEPPRHARKEAPNSGSKVSLLNSFVDGFFDVLCSFRMRTFCVILFQGALASISVRSFNYKTLYLQLKGMNDFQTSFINSSFAFACCLGAVLGAFVADSLFRWSKRHGRAIAGQMTLLAGVPILYLMFMVAPPEHGAFHYYLVLVCLQGLFATWCYCSVVLPIMAMLLDKDRRATTMALFSTMETTCGILCGNIMVSFLAEQVFGYSFGASGIAAAPHDAQALGGALFLSCVLPQVGSFCFVSLLHWSMPRDLDVIEAKQQVQAELGDIDAEQPPRKDCAKVSPAAKELKKFPLQRAAYQLLTQNELDNVAAV